MLLFILVYLYKMNDKNVNDENNNETSTLETTTLSPDQKFIGYFIVMRMTRTLPDISPLPYEK